MPRFLPQAVAALLLTLVAGAANAATFTVTKTADTNDGACNADCSLREAVAAAQKTLAEDYISFNRQTFSRDQTIRLKLGELVVDRDVQIYGPYGAMVTIDGSKTSRVFNIKGGNVSLSHLVIANGSAIDPLNGDGGCIKVYDANFNMYGCAVTGGTAELGGGIAALRSYMALTNCTIARNKCVGINPQGGGINNNEDCVTRLTNCTIADNSAYNPKTKLGTGGGIMNLPFRDGGLSLYGTLIAANIAGPESDSSGAPDLFSSDDFFESNSLIGNTAQTGGPELITAPRFEVDENRRPWLKDNGGHTLTIALQPGSPALNAFEAELSEDQRGARRGGVSDIGAYERDLPPVSRA